jgi:hypothetical protein
MQLLCCFLQKTVLYCSLSGPTFFPLDFFSSTQFFFFFAKPESIKENVCPSAKTRYVPVTPIRLCRLEAGSAISATAVASHSTEQEQRVSFERFDDGSDGYRRVTDW